MNKLIVSLASGLAALALVGSVAAARIPPSPNLPPGWSHAEINIVIKGQPHTLVYDRGRVQQVTASSLTLREPDGQIQTIDVAANANITIAGSAATLSQVRVREQATTLGIDGGPAVSVRVQIPPALAALIARQQGTQHGTRR